MTTESEESMGKSLVIYHGGCRDGFCAAWVAHTFLKDTAEYIPAFYGAPPIDVKGRRVLMVDFSYPRDVMERMHSEADSLLCLDHHKTAEDALRGLPFARFDMERSGAGMAFDHFCPEGPRPTLVNYVEDRDLWRHALPHSEEVNAWIGTLPFDFSAWNAATTDIAQDAIETFNSLTGAIRKGQAVLAKVAQYVAEVRKNSRIVMMDGSVVPLVNAPQVDISELLSVMCEGYPFSVGWFQRTDRLFQYSLRSRGEFDVSALAKTYGGGGHKNAAGFVSESMLF